jgi:hypothetical protein
MHVSAITQERFMTEKLFDELALRLLKAFFARITALARFWLRWLRLPPLEQRSKLILQKTKTRKIATSFDVALLHLRDQWMISSNYPTKRVLL